jgi:hypothetical protein
MTEAHFGCSFIQRWFVGYPTCANRCAPLPQHLLETMVTQSAHHQQPHVIAHSYHLTHVIVAALNCQSSVKATTFTPSDQEKRITGYCYSLVYFISGATIQPFRNMFTISFT